MIIKPKPRVEDFIHQWFSFKLEPFSAFDLAWFCARSSDLDTVIYTGRRFLEALEDHCELASPVRRQSPPKTGDLSAMWNFVATISQLLDTWRRDQLLAGSLGIHGANWFERNPDILSRVQAAQNTRRRCCVLAEEDYTVKEVMAGAHLKQEKKLVLLWEDKLTGQRTWVQAAQTLAYALFGDFLAGDPKSISFCRKCERPFFRAKKTVYCSSQCAHSLSKTTSRHDSRAKKRRTALLRAARHLNEWLRKPPRAGSDWRTGTESAFGLISSHGRRSRLMSDYIQASRTHSGSPERKKLLRSLLPWGAENSLKNQKVAVRLEGFLENIKTAQSSLGSSGPSAHRP